MMIVVYQNVSDTLYVESDEANLSMFKESQKC